MQLPRRAPARPPSPRLAPFPRSSPTRTRPVRPLIADHNRSPQVREGGQRRRAQRDERGGPAGGRRHQGPPYDGTRTDDRHRIRTRRRPLDNPVEVGRSRGRSGLPRLGDRPSRPGEYEVADALVLVDGEHDVRLPAYAKGVESGVGEARGIIHRQGYEWTHVHPPSPSLSVNRVPSSVVGDIVRDELHQRGEHAPSSRVVHQHVARAQRAGVLREPAERNEVIILASPVALERRLLRAHRFQPCPRACPPHVRTP